jgi:hypothetical protein
MTNESQQWEAELKEAGWKPFAVHPNSPVCYSRWTPYPALLRGLFMVGVGMNTSQNKQRPIKGEHFNGIH